MRRGGPNLWFVVAMILVLAVVLVMMQSPQRSTISYDFFMAQVEKTKPCNIASVELGDIDATGVFKQPPDAPPRGFSSRCYPFRIRPISPRRALRTASCRAAATPRITRPS